METSRVVKTFLEYVQISSESRWEAAFSQRLAEDLQQIGLTVETDDSADKVKANTGNLYAFLPGEADLEPILLCAHMDTVPPGQGIHPVIEDGIIRSASDTILGSDDKSGAAAIVEALREIVQQKLPHRPVEVVFTICEEVGLLGAKYLDYSRLRAKKAVVFDNEGDVGTIVNQAPGHVEISATITGRAAHAGVAPEEGISAIQVAAEAVSQMQLLRIDAETTANIGTFFAAGPNNIVPETVRLAAEVRSLDPQKLKRQCRQITDALQTACQKYGASLQYSEEPSYSGYQIAETDPWIQQLKDCLHALDYPVRLCATGGGSDANILNQNGIQAVVVGTGMEKIHTVSEYITLQNLERTKAFTMALIQK